MVDPSALSLKTMGLDGSYFVSPGKFNLTLFHLKTFAGSSFLPFKKGSSLLISLLFLTRKHPAPMHKQLCIIF